MSRRLKLNRQLFDLPPLRPLGRSIHAARIAHEEKSQSTATRFFRNIKQLTALKGPLTGLAENGRRFRALVAGCSYGCEAYSLAGYLALEFPSLDWSIDAFDISSEAVLTARQAIFTRDHGLGEARDTTEDRIAKLLFERASDRWIVVPAIRRRVNIEQADILAGDCRASPGYDLVLAQNFLVHMEVTVAREAFARAVTATKPGGALFVGGMPLDLKPALVREHGLLPLDWEIEAIHEEDGMRRSAWPWHYWALEPADRRRPDFVARYSTIFLKPAG